MRYVIFLISFLIAGKVIGQANDGTLHKPLNYYLPDIAFNPAITTPEAFLGFQVGEWHVSHDLMVSYMKLLAAQSERVDVIEYGRTHENRALITLYISSPENLARKEQIRQSSIALTDDSRSSTVDISQLPVVLYQGYTIHGNESSGVNAALLVAYYLAAGEGEEVKKTLQNCFIILDPCYNPDGMQRFSTWANSHKGKTLISDPVSREYNEMWPGGRTNHYGFDLNRDWLMLVHPESQARVKHFHQWKPNVLTDHHEMGSNSTFFFQPGVPSRTHPLTPAMNQILTEKIGVFHSRALDSIGSQYYSKESFDDFYYGKGSTYPDIQGGIGILFEQASSRGHMQESVNGLLSFPFTIRNQVVTSLSTQRACVQLKNDLHNYKRQFFTDLRSELKNEKTQGYLITDRDVVKLERFVQLLLQHQVEVLSITRDFTKDGVSFQKGGSFLIPVQQSQGKLVKTLFEKVTRFQDSIFYDVSAWTFPLAYDLSYAALSKEETASLASDAKAVTQIQRKSPSIVCNERAIAWVIEWQQANAPTLLYQLLQKQIAVKINTSSMDYNSDQGLVTAAEGSLWIPLQGQTMAVQDIASWLKEKALSLGVNVSSMMDGTQAQGVSLGHPSICKAALPTVITLVGQGINAYDAGELWHFMDQRLGLALTMADKKDLNKVSFDRYNTLILVDGSYNDLQESSIKKIEEFVKKGGKIIAMGNSLDILKNKSLIKLDKVDNPKNKDNGQSYAQADDIHGSSILGGAIFNTTADLSHPLCFGLADDQLALFKQGTDVYKAPDNAFASPIRYSSQNPLLSGYSPRGFEDRLKGSPAAMTFGAGNGTIMCFPDNLLFRGYWWGGFRVFANALFFGNMINRDTLGK